MKKKTIVIIIIILLVLGGAVFYYLAARQPVDVYTTVLVQKGSLVQTVNETGAVKSISELNLSFSNAGRLYRINSEVGSLAKKDEVLAELDTSALLIAKNEATANLSVAQTTLSKLLNGATTEDKAVARANLQQARTSYQSALNELGKARKSVAENIAQAEKNWRDLDAKTAGDVTTFEQAIATAQTNLASAKSTYQQTIDNNKRNAINAIDNKLAAVDYALDTIDRTINDEGAKDLISVKNFQYLTDTKSGYSASLILVAQAKISLAAAKSSGSESDLSIALVDALNSADKTFTALESCYKALENSIISANDLTQAELDAFKANISGQQTAVAAAVSSIQTAKHAFDDSLLSYNTNISAAEENLRQAQAAYSNALTGARNSLSSARANGEKELTAAESRTSAGKEAVLIAEAQYNKTIAPADRYDKALAEAKVRQAQAAVDSIDKQIENSLLKSPIDAIVTKVNFKAGEQIMAGSQVISVLTQNNFEIEILISEADIAKVKKNDQAEITLDAFGDGVVFKGGVIFIEPAETIIQGVIYYKVKLNFDTEKRDVKSGMTANATIVTARKENILVIPNRAVIQKNGQGKIVRVLINNRIQEKTVTIGLSGDEGMVEVLSGLNEGEAVVTFISNK